MIGANQEEKSCFPNWQIILNRSQVLFFFQFFMCTRVCYDRCAVVWRQLWGKGIYLFLPANIPEIELSQVVTSAFTWRTILPAQNGYSNKYINLIIQTRSKPSWPFTPAREARAAKEMLYCQNEWWRTQKVSKGVTGSLNDRDGWKGTQRKEGRTRLASSPCPHPHPKACRRTGTVWGRQGSASKHQCARRPWIKNHKLQRQSGELFWRRLSLQTLSSHSTVAPDTILV